MATFADHVKILKVRDGYADDEMIEAFKGQDAVVLCLNHSAEHRHAALADASIKAGVKHLVASIYGGNLNSKSQELFPLAAKKAKLVQELRARETAGWEWTGISCGLFFDLCVQPFSFNMQPLLTLFSCISNGFFGFNPSLHTGQIWDSGNTTFSATNVATVGLAVAKVLASPAETANRLVYISSFECSMNDILQAYKNATNVSDWRIAHVDTDEEIESATDNFTRTGQMMALGRLALASMVKEGIGANFMTEGLLDNELLGLPRESESVEKTVSRVLKEKLST